MTWLVQYAGMRPDNTDEVMSILKAKGIPFVPVGIRPFTTEIMGLDEADLSGPVMAYGSCKLVKLVSELGLRPGVFFDHSSFNAMAWTMFLESYMVNPYIYGPVRDFRKETITGPVFIRPVMDLKTFSGGVKPEGMSVDDYLTEKLQGSTQHENMIVAAALPQVIHGEWRCFIVNRKLVTASQYRINGELKPDPSTPLGLETFVELISAMWLPHDHCTMDVALVENPEDNSQKFKVMEFNCINASGLYKADAEKLVDALNSLMV